MWWIEVFIFVCGAVVLPLLQELGWSVAAKTIIIGDEGEEGKLVGQDDGTEMDVVAD